MQAQKSLDLRIAKPLALFVSDFSTPSGAVDMFDNASVADGVSAWTRQLKGALTTLDNAVGGPPAGVSYDAARNILYVARFQGSDNGAVLAFHNADAVDGNADPDRIIQAIVSTPFPLSLNSPSDVFIDSGNDRIYIADVTGSSGIIFILDNASTAPTFRKIFNFLPGPPAAISVDIGRDILYVVPSQGQEIIAYDNISDLTGAQRTITIGSTAGVGLVDVKIDPATDTAYAADYDGGRVFVINDVSQKSGPGAPDRALTGLSNPNSVFLDVANDRLFVSNRDGATSYSVGVVEEMSSVNGPVSFSRELSGFGTAAGMTGYYK
jgi:DNA-binding beta-propeller fold protein YncE